jgi:hypothetical protein
MFTKVPRKGLFSFFPQLRGRPMTTSVTKARLVQVATTELGMLRAEAGSNWRSVPERRVLQSYLRLLDALHHSAQGMNGAADLRRRATNFTFVDASAPHVADVQEVINYMTEYGRRPDEILGPDKFPNTTAVWQLIAQHCINRNKRIAAKNQEPVCDSDDDAIRLQHMVLALYSAHPTF